jgi:cytochrome c oxidase subunit 2
MRLIVWGGVAFPTLVLAALLGYGLTLLTDLRAPGDGLRIAVSGERYWWRVRYQMPSSRGSGAKPGVTVESANELRLPLGERTELMLESPDVIHSLWIPTLAGKMDMIPGRSNRLVVEPTEAGHYGGVCAEFCGTAHARMALDVIVMSRVDFDRWLADQAKPAALGVTSAGQQGFLASGCGACHQVRGTEANGRIGPDLTHVGSRPRIGAGLLPTTVDNLASFIADTEKLKPGVRMPSFGMLPEQRIRDMASWLESLK